MNSISAAMPTEAMVHIVNVISAMKAPRVSSLFSVSHARHYTWYRLSAPAGGRHHQGQAQIKAPVSSAGKKVNSTRLDWLSTATRVMTSPDHDGKCRPAEDLALQRSP
jgi:hypothetical protein